MDSRNDRAGSFIKATIRTQNGFVYKNPEPLIFEIQNEKITDMNTGVTFLGFNDFFMHFQSFHTNTLHGSFSIRGKLKIDSYPMRNFLTRHRGVSFSSYHRLRNKSISDIASTHKKRYNHDFRKDRCLNAYDNH